jgi:hypothetical protein
VPWAFGTSPIAAVDRINPARVFGSPHCFGRGTCAPDSEKLCGLLQRRENASISKQRCAGFTPGSAIRLHKFRRPLGRTSSPLRSGLSFRHTQRGRAIEGRKIMAANTFISFDHDDQRQVARFKLLKSSPKHPLDFQDHSLKDAVRDRSGKPIKYPPSDARSKPVRDAIIKKFENASKLVVLRRQHAQERLGRLGNQ